MKPLLFTFVLSLITAGTLFPQQFIKKFSIELPDSIHQAQTEWADLDNDGLLDNLLFVQNLDGENFMMIIPGDTLNTPSIHSTSVTLPAYIHYAIHDYDNDNQLDILYATESSSGWLKNTGHFTFQDIALHLPPFKGILFSDVTDDGQSECIVFGEDDSGYFLYTLEGSAATSWRSLHDSLHIDVNDIKIVDLDKDGFNDLFLSGRESPDSIFTAVFLKRNENFVLAGKINALSKAIYLDVDLDSYPEIIAWTEGPGLSEKFLIEYDQNDTVNFIKTEETNRIFSLWYADFNSDGIIEEAFSGKTTDLDTLNTIRFEDGTTEKLPYNIASQSFGDIERDGDIDLVQVTGQSKLSVDYYENTTNQKNNYPTGPNHGIAFKVYDWLFMYWEKSSDDHTPQQAITYDIYLEGSTVHVNGSFDIENENRLTVSQGNNATSNFKLLKNFKESDFNFIIQAVDNSLHAGKGGTCIGSRSSCVSLTKEKLSMCEEESRTLHGTENAQWFSLRNGFLGQGLTFEYQALSRDTLFYFDPEFQTCPIVKIFEISIDNTVIKLPQQDLYGCTSQEILLQGFGAETTWTSEKLGAIGRGSEITFTIETDDLVSAKFQNSAGCNIQKAIAIQRSAPQLIVEPPDAVILLGTSVQLMADGATTYNWSPAEGLSSVSIAAPIASPVDDIKYTVTGYDSLGCTSTAAVSIRVERNGFLPSLFTPNSDGKNDELKIYGLLDTNSFHFIITDRSGVVVYETNNARQATNQGWDGKVNAVAQPSGVYFWHVEGQLISGETLLLNGKKEGSILLLR